MDCTYVEHGPPAADFGEDGDMHGDMTTHIWRLKKGGVWTFFADHSAIAAEDKKHPAPTKNGNRAFFPQRMEEFRGPFKWVARDVESPDPVDLELAVHQRAALDMMLGRR